MPPPSRPAPTIINRCTLSPWAIGSHEFQDNPQALEIAGVRAADRRLFQRLDTIEDPAERTRYFHDYLAVKFRLHEWTEHQTSARSALRASYLQHLHGWGADSNGRAGAVLKAWVESRFGLPPTFHGGRLPDDPEALAKFHIDRAVGAARTVTVAMQLDLLHTFSQYELARRHGDTRWLTLYRGTPDAAEYAVRDRAPGDIAMVLLNNLSSFTADAEVAWECGSQVWEVRVPLSKIAFAASLLPPQTLGAEADFLVLGGDYRVKTLLY